MKNSDIQFGDLLKQGLWTIRRRESKLIGTIRDEIGYALGRKGGSIVEHWAKGNLPPTLDDVEALTRIIVYRGNVGETWVMRFLTVAGHPQAKELCSQLLSETGFPPSQLREGNRESNSSTVVTSLNVSMIDGPSDWEQVIGKTLEPQTYSQLFGISEYRERLEEYLLQSDDTYIVVIHGLGGLGKTTLADYTVRQPQMGQKFTGVVWMDFKQYSYIPEYGTINVERIPFDIEAFVESLTEQLDLADSRSLPPRQKQNAIIRHLRELPYLIVIDNLESSADNQQLLVFLRSLIRPSKVIITSRYSLSSYGDVAHIRLAQLPEERAYEFLRHLAELHGSAHLAGATDAHLHQIYVLVGGNPLALRLVVSQILALSLPIVLKNLAQIPDHEIDTFYDFIYHSSWELLTSDAQKLIKLMPLVDHASTAQLSAIANLPDTELYAALRQLVRMSLLEAHGVLEERRYTILRLTETFLQKQTIDWLAPQDLTDEEPSIQLAYSVQQNLVYWQAWLASHGDNVKKVDTERAGIVKAILFGLNVPDAWPSTYALIEEMSLYMEQRGQWETWSHVLSMAIETAKQSTDISRLPRLSLLYARLLRRQSRYQDAVSAYWRAIQLARQAQDEFTKARAWSNLGHLYIELDHWWRAEVLCHHALQFFERCESNHGRAHTHNHLGILHTRQGRWDDAYCHLEQALTLWQSMDHQHGQFLANINLGKLVNDMRAEGVERAYVSKGYSSEAVRYGKQSADEVSLAIARMNLGITKRLDGNIEAAEEEFLTSAAIFNRYGDLLGLALIADNLGIIRASQNRIEDAVMFFQQALDQWQALKSAYGEIRTLLYLVECAADWGNQERIQYWLESVEAAFRQEHRAIKYASLYRKYQELSHRLQL